MRVVDGKTSGFRCVRIRPDRNRKELEQRERERESKVARICADLLQTVTLSYLQRCSILGWRYRRVDRRLEPSIDPVSFFPPRIFHRR